MKVTSETAQGTVTDVVCDMCGVSTRIEGGELQFGTMHAKWGEGSAHSGEEYELHLCEGCFFVQVASMKRTRWTGMMFEEEGDAILGNDAYGQVSKESAGE